MNKIKIALTAFVLALSLAAIPAIAQTPVQQQQTVWDQVADYFSQWALVRKIHDYFWGSSDLASSQPPAQTAQQLMQRAQQLSNLTPLEQRQEVADMTRQSAQMIRNLPADQQQAIQSMAMQFSKMTPQQQQAQAQQLIQQSQQLIQNLPEQQRLQIQQTFSQASRYLAQAQAQQQQRVQPQESR